MTDHATHAADGRQTIQLLVAGDSDRTALETLLGDRYDVVVDDSLQTVDCYLVGDRMVPRYREELQAIKSEADPTFCPVLLLRREDSNVTVPPPAEQSDDGPSLVDEVVTAPVDQATLHRRLGNLLTRRAQSVELSEQYEDVQTRFQQLFDATNDAIIVVAPSGEEFLECNPAACDLVGYARETFLSLSPADVIHSDYRERFQSLLQSVEGTDDGWTGELEVVTNEGDTRHLEVSAAPLGTSDQSPVVLSARDVTERQAYQRELELKSRAMDEAPVGITISDPDQEDNPMVYVNDGFREITGYAAAESTGRNCRFLQGEGTREEPVAAMRAAIDAEEPVSVELRNYRKDGTQFWNRVSIAPVRDDDGTVTNYVGFQQDVTERRQREQDLQLFKRAVENTEQTVFITDREGVIEYVNPAFEAQTGYSKEEAIGRTPSILKSGKQGEAFYNELWETLLTGESWDSHLINQRKNGELYHIDQTISTITDAAGEISHFIAVESDVTDRRLREQQLDVLNRVLRHNLRNGMSVIEGHIELLRDAVDDEKLQEHLNTIENRTDALGRLSDKAGTVRSLFDDEYPEDIACDVGAFLPEIVDEFADSQPEATFSISGPDSIYVRADSRLRLALIELLDNAVTHSERSDPEVTVSIRVSNADRSGDWVEISIADDGPGLPEDEQKTIETGEETPLQHGTGLGLWIVHWTVSLFGGEIILEENTPRGTRIILVLPRASEDEVADQRASDAD
jgi:PAS domain S-box-containing protein